MYLRIHTSMVTFLRNTKKKKKSESKAITSKGGTHI